MKVITVGNTKGGVGKSTLAANLASIASGKGLRVLLVDADPQGSTVSFRQDRQTDDIQAIALTQPTLHKDIPSFGAAFDLVVIDVGRGGTDNATLGSAMLAADILILPVLPSQYDIDALVDTLGIFQQAKVYKEELKGYIVLNRMIHAKLGAEAVVALDAISKKWSVPVLNTRLYNRVAYGTSIVKGQGVVEYEPAGKAAEEVRALYDEIMALLA